MQCRLTTSMLTMPGTSASVNSGVLRVRHEHRRDLDYVGAVQFQLGGQDRLHPVEMRLAAVVVAPQRDAFSASPRPALVAFSSGKSSLSARKSVTENSTPTRAGTGPPSVRSQRADEHARSAPPARRSRIA